MKLKMKNLLMQGKRRFIVHIHILGANKNSKSYGNFLSYVYKADDIFSQSKLLESNIRNQIKKHWYKIDSKLKR